MCDFDKKSVNPFGRVENFANTHIASRVILPIIRLISKDYPFPLLPNYIVKQINSLRG